MIVQKILNKREDSIQQRASTQLREEAQKCIIPI